MRLCFLGGYDPEYPRNTVIRKGLRENGVEVSECRVSPRLKFWLRYPVMFFRSRPGVLRSDFIFVPEFCQKDLPLARALSELASKKVIFDPLAARFETKIVDWGRKPAHSWQARWNYRIDSWAFRLSDLILADTGSHKKHYCQKYRLPSDKIEVLPVGFDSDIFNPSRTQPLPKQEHFQVLFFGSFLPLHGVETILESAKILSTQDPAVRFRLVGSGQTRPQARALASELDLNNVFFENWVSQRNLPHRIASCQVCLGIFGKGEKAKRVVPHKIFQAMAMRKPVITLRTPAVEEFFSDRVNVFLCPDSKPSSLAQAILQLKRDSRLREEIGGRGYRLVSQHFSPRATGRRLLEILERHFGRNEKGEVH
ncbi:MAG: glycosyltransferase [Candidatus Aminicenantes bacterium]